MNFSYSDYLRLSMIRFDGKRILKFRILQATSQSFLIKPKSTMLNYLNEEQISIQANSVYVTDYLGQNGIPNAITYKFEQNQIDGLSFCLINDYDLNQMGIQSIGLRKRILYLSSKWREKIVKDKQILKHFILSHKLSKNSFNTETDLLLLSSSSSNLSNPEVSSLGGVEVSTPLPVSKSTCSPTFSSSLLSDSFIESNGDHEWINSTLGENTLLNDYDCTIVEKNSKSWKLFISGLYFFLSTGITSFVMVLAHERLPDISTYPPLPDLFLDNLPYISWGFHAAELVGVLLSIIWLLILIFHKHRWILIRRFFVLTGTVFFLRSITMIITSLSVPGTHLAKQCSPYVIHDQYERFKRVFDIWIGMGMSISGIQTCGDYMFSGHTSCLILLNFFITEYCPRKLQFIHTFSWVLNLFGIFFILASHEHYSIDVFIAIYVSSRLFLYYHCLANSNILHQPDKERTMIWFPLFSFMEYDVNAIVPNVYEIPFYNFFFKDNSNLNVKSDVIDNKSVIVNSCLNGCNTSISSNIGDMTVTPTISMNNNIATICTTTSTPVNTCNTVRVNKLPNDHNLNFETTINNDDNDGVSVCNGKAYARWNSQCQIQEQQKLQNHKAYENMIFKKRNNSESNIHLNKTGYNKELIHEKAT